MTDKKEEKTKGGAAENPAKEKFVAVCKDGETIKVCAAQVEQHQRLGWTVKG